MLNWYSKLSKYKKAGIVSAVLTILFWFIRLLYKGNWDGAVGFSLLSTLPWLLCSYGIYIWDDELKPRNEKTAEAEEKTGQDESD